MNMKIFAMGLLTTLLASSAFADMSTPSVSGTSTMSGTTSPTMNQGSTTPGMSGATAPSGISGATSGMMSGTAQPQQ